MEADRLHQCIKTQVNVILMISDGFGPASETFARSYLQHLVQSKDAMVQPGGRWAGLVPSAKDSAADYRLTLPLDSILIGSSRTRSSDSLVTDSAAGATAFSCAIKSYNGAIGVDPTEKRNPCGTVLEAARHQGYKTGLVVTSRITHATPAAFYAHVPDRDMESTIAEQMVMNHPLGQQVDLAFGGGLCFFLPNSSSTSCRADALDLIAASKDKKNSKPKYSFITDRSAFDALPADVKSLGTIGLFGADHLEYEIDRLQMGNTEEEKQPALSEMADKAINILRSAVKSQNAHGFFLMIEGSRIDMAGHSNDPG
jgi:alkaline phosphatase